MDEITEVLRKAHEMLIEAYRLTSDAYDALSDAKELAEKAGDTDLVEDIEVALREMYSPTFDRITEDLV